jgi:hypothetical protein
MVFCRFVCFGAVLGSQATPFGTTLAANDATSQCATRVDGTAAHVSVVYSSIHAYVRYHHHALRKTCCAILIIWNLVYSHTHVSSYRSNNNNRPPFVIAPKLPAPPHFLDLEFECRTVRMQLLGLVSGAGSVKKKLYL